MSFTEPENNRSATESSPARPAESAGERLKSPYQLYTWARPCPRCSLTDTRRRRRRMWEKVIFCFTNVRAYRCHNCGRSFYARRRPSTGSYHD